MEANVVRVGIDVGGTFTDVALVNEVTGQLEIQKVPSTDQPEVGISVGLHKILERLHVTPQDVAFLAHGSTVATNAVLEGKGAKVGLITTRGFEDLLEIARQKRPHLYDLFAEKPRPLIPSQLRIGVRERTLANGDILIPLDNSDVESAIEALVAANVEAVAVCFLHAHTNPEHELHVKAALHSRAAHLFVSLSSEVSPEFREYERLVTTVLNAYLGPRVSNYMLGFGNSMKDSGIQCPLLVAQSNGGMFSPKHASERPVRLLLSGPSAGVAGASAIATRAGLKNILTLDMGGTSTDVAVVRNGVPLWTPSTVIANLPIRTPVLDIQTIGAGGGSIARVDEWGRLSVGPESTGSVPGPACYGLGGSLPTITDSNLVLGRLDPDTKLADSITPNITLAIQAIEQHVASKLGIDLFEAANAVAQYARSAMVNAIRLITVDRGLDPRSFTLVAFGGSGPLHAIEVARDLGVASVLIPARPGILCAQGLLETDVRYDFVDGRHFLLEETAYERLLEGVNGLWMEGSNWLSEENIPAANRALSFYAELRYERQNYELTVPLGNRSELASLESILSTFHEIHRTRYGYASPGERVVVVSIRVQAIGLQPRIQPAPNPDRSGARRSGLQKTREVWFDVEGATRPLSTMVLDRSELNPGDAIEGPAVVGQMDSTILLPPGCVAEVDGYDNLRVRLFQGELK